MVSTSRKKSLSKRILFQIDRKLVLISGNGKFVEYLCTRRNNCLHWQEYLQNKIKWLPIAVRRVLNSLLYNLNNGFHGKLRIKNNTFSFGHKNGFPLSGMKRSFKNIWVNGRKWFPLARKSFSTSKISSVFKNCFPLISVTVSGIRKKVSKKLDGFHKIQNPFPRAGIKHSFKNTFPLDGKKKLSLAGVSEKYNNMTCTSQKISCHYPEWSIRWKIHFHDTEKLQKLKAKKIKENSFHYHENVFLLKLVPPIGFQQQKNALNKSILFPLNKK